MRLSILRGRQWPRTDLITFGILEPMAVLLVLLTLSLAFANGANDVSKGIATLVGSGGAEFKRAVWWGTIWTVLGGLCAALASQGLVAAFSGKALLVLPQEGHQFLIAVAGGASLWVLFASKSSLPVSTTHAITGALCGAGLMAAGPDGVQWAAVVKKFAIPLFLSPLLSMGLIFFLSPLIRAAFGGFQKYCVCVEEGKGVCLRPAGAAAVAIADAPKLVLGEAAACAAEPTLLAQVNGMDALHWLAAGLTSFARGLNDTPKILAMGAAASAALGLGQPFLYVLVALAMGAGSAIWGFRVTETLATKVTKMTHAEGFSANLVTSVLVTFASRLALPVSTTHVSSGAIIGIGLKKGGGGVHWGTVRDMLLAWLITLPVSALFAAGSYFLVSRL